MFAKIPHSTRLKMIISLLALDSAFFTLTDPAQVNSLVLIASFLLLSLTCYLLISRLCAVAQLYGLPLGHPAHRIALFGTVVIVGLTALQSIGELSIRDMLVALPLGIVLYLYLSYSRSKLRLPNTV